ncbi:diphthine--ammonia ligase [Anaerobacillus sp. 1_MG-2023]|uniref:Dph6-related ATP pyrophosphatase n=1 Tax=Bacillales TaxID=1385 RepID=UPI0026E2C999|nr:diphthine--ammonia ligase [Anaerobacillus sp. 1_MG-2023]MDO6657565.1 diphthine--ammonia ligase [Anaerobacillus sp. 1_MG-2023]
MNLIFSWSSGKDSAIALFDCLKQSHLQVKGLWTTVNETNGAIPFHGVHAALLEKQIAAIGLPLTITNLPDNCTNKQYEKLVSAQYKVFKEAEIEGIVFADLFLDDIRRYRETLLQECKLKGIYPLWQHSTLHTAKRFVSTGFKAVITTVDQSKISPDWIGKPFDDNFLQSLPDHVDPCGENGEFHTFVSDGPIFEKEVIVEIQEIVEQGKYRTAILKTW